MDSKLISLLAFIIVLLLIVLTRGWSRKDFQFKIIDAVIAIIPATLLLVDFQSLTKFAIGTDGLQFEKQAEAIRKYKSVKINEIYNELSFQIYSDIIEDVGGIKYPSYSDEQEYVKKIYKKHNVSLDENDEPLLDNEENLDAANKEIDAYYERNRESKEELFDKIDETNGVIFIIGRKVDPVEFERFINSIEEFRYDGFFDSRYVHITNERGEYFSTCSFENFTDEDSDDIQKFAKKLENNFEFTQYHSSLLLDGASWCFDKSEAVLVDEPLKVAVSKFEENSSEELPVLNQEKRLVGEVSRTNVVNNAILTMLNATN